MKIYSTMNLRISLFLPAVVMFVLSAPGCTIKPPEAHLVGIKVNSICPTEVGFQCEFKIVNPNNWGADIESMECAMIAGDEQLAGGKAVEPMPKIPAMSVTTVPVNVSLNQVKTYRLFKEYRKGGTLPYTLIAKPVFRVLGTTIPITIKEDKELPTFKELQEQAAERVIDMIKAGMKKRETGGDADTEDSHE